ncbi:MAG TPA: ABC transporter substrate-binding protein [Candidatus Binatia bacterium]|jgi:NitT/TauT family transport system substrate-binding protein
MTDILEKRFIAALVWLLCLAGAAAPARSAEPLENVTVSFPTLTLSMAPWWIARDAGIFASEGINAEIAFIRGSGTTVQALVGGSIQAGYAGAPPVAAAIASGAKLVIVAAPVNRMDYVLVTRQPVKAHELKGKRFAIGRLGDSNEIATRVALERMGVDPGTVKLVAIGGSPDRIAALRSNSVDAAILSGTEFLGTGSSEFHMLFDVAQAGIEYPFDTIFVTRRYLAEKRKTVLSTLKAFVRAVRFLRTEKQQSLKIASRWLRNPDPAVLERQWKHVAFNLYQENPYPTDPAFRLAFKGMAQINPKVGELSTSDVVDTSLLDELERSGYFKSH